MSRLDGVGGQQPGAEPFGLGAALGSWLSVLALSVLPSIGLVMRIKVEEKALLAALGQPYRDYAEQRRRLVPGLW